MNVLLNLIILIACSLQPLEAVEPGWYVVGAGIEPGKYFIFLSSSRNLDDGNSIDVDFPTQPPEPDREGEQCTVIAFSDYWTESRGISVQGGYAFFTVRPSDYAIMTTCPMLKVNDTFDPSAPFTPAIGIAGLLEIST
ncbi:MAG: hypothetical protein SVT56_04900 [Chloroflexota bacterium]|nr:hypothetical protein [Chloroflexota bacterium]